jgi:glycosyltransferase involved in cell wall biosynthesis
MKRPVALVLGPHLEAVSGVSTHLRLLLASPLAKDFRLVQFQVGSEGRDEGPLGRALRLAFAPLSLAGAILARNAAIVHINTSLNARAYWRDLVYLAVAKLCGARVVYQVHGGALPHRFFRGNRLLEALLRGTLRLADAVVVLARIELRAYRKFLPGLPVVALPNAIDYAQYARLKRGPAREAVPLRLVYIGRLAREKGLIETLQGLKLAQGQGVQAQLALAGSGPDEQRLRQLVQEMQLSADVAFVGPVFGEAKARLLASADVLVLASHAEGLPYALLEGMAAGDAVIVTRVGAIPDVVVDGVHGFFVPPHNPLAIARAIGRLAADRGLLARMSEAGRRRIAGSYSLERLAADFRRLYSELCTHVPGPKSQATSHKT